METRANYILIGAFTLMGILGALGFFGWLAKVEIDRQYAEYDILFESVSGLGRASDVRFNGLSVGQVIALDLYDQDPGKVKVRIEVAAETPVKADTVAQLQAQGVTGVSFVALAGGSPSAPLLRDQPDGGVPLIPSERSVVQALTEDAPDLVTEAIAVMKDLKEFVGPENQAYVQNILQNLDRASGQLDQALTDFSAISNSVSEATGQITEFTGRLDAIGNAIQTSLTNVDETLEVTRTTIAQGELTLNAATDALTAAQSTFASADDFLQKRLPQIADDLSTTLRNADTLVTDLGAETRDVVARFGGTADLASARLTEFETTLKALDATLADARAAVLAVDSASVSFQTLMDGEGVALVADARTAFANLDGAVAALNQVIAQDVPVIMTDIRGAVETANRVMDGVGADVGAFAERLDPLTVTAETTLQTATDTLRKATESLGRLDVTMETADRALAAAEQAFEGANRVIDEDVGPAMADIRSAAEKVDTAMTDVSADLPAITEDLRAAIARAAEVITRIDEAVATSVGPVRDFAVTGLPEFTRFARAAQDLTARLDDIAKKIERDPSRFFFGNTPPEFRR